MLTRPHLPDGPFTCDDAKRAGITRWRLDELVATRQVVRVLRGVYRPCDLPDTVENRARAAALVVSPFAVVTDRTASWIHGVDTFEYRELGILPPLEIHVLRDHHRVERDGCVGGERDLLPRDVCLIGGVAVTTPVRTALDLGCRLSRSGGLAALDGFMRELGVTRAQLDGEVPRYFRRRGVVQLRRLVPIADARAESPGESWTRMEIIDAGLPAPEPQFWVVYDGVALFRLDLAYPWSKVCVEYDGREFHEGDDAKVHDEQRREWLRRHGWTVIVVTKDDFTLEAKAIWLDQLRTALRLAA
jgi:hypothetical protein